MKFPLGFFSLSMWKPLHSFLLPQGNFPREDFLFDEEKNSWQLPRGKEYEDFLFDEGKNLIETSIV